MVLENICYATDLVCSSRILERRKHISIIHWCERIPRGGITNPEETWSNSVRTLLVHMLTHGISLTVELCYSCSLYPWMGHTSCKICGSPLCSVQIPSDRAHPQPTAHRKSCWDCDSHRDLQCKYHTLNIHYHNISWNTQTLFGARVKLTWNWRARGRTWCGNWIRST